MLDLKHYKPKANVNSLKTSLARWCGTGSDGSYLGSLAESRRGGGGIDSDSGTTDVSISWLTSSRNASSCLPWISSISASSSAGIPSTLGRTSSSLSE